MVWICIFMTFWVPLYKQAKVTVASFYGLDDAVTASGNNDKGFGNSFESLMVAGNDRNSRATQNRGQPASLSQTDLMKIGVHFAVSVSDSFSDHGWNILKHAAAINGIAELHAETDAKNRLA